MTVEDDPGFGARLGTRWRDARWAARRRRSSRLTGWRQPGSGPSRSSTHATFCAARRCIIRTDRCDCVALETEAAVIAAVGTRGVPVPAIRHVLSPEDDGSGFVMDHVEGEGMGPRIVHGEGFLDRGSAPRSPPRAGGRSQACT
ncbi:hypothetical protein AB5I41_08590 [Sphingomonas sp. MMS24-JH45]